MRGPRGAWQRSLRLQPSVELVSDLQRIQLPYAGYQRPQVDKQFRFDLRWSLQRVHLGDRPAEKHPSREAAGPLLIHLFHRHLFDLLLGVTCYITKHLNGIGAKIWPGPADLAVM